MEKNIKKLSAAEQDEIATLRQSETKTAQIALTRTDIDSILIDSIAFFSRVTPTVSPAVHKAALTPIYAEAGLLTQAPMCISAIRETGLLN